MLIKTTEFANSVYDIIVNMGGALEEHRLAFVYDHLDIERPCREWRFQGHLGFGGKYRSERNQVDCYSEDETPERIELIKEINLSLSTLITL